MSALPQRFWDKVDQTESCWLWTGALVWGYGVMNVKVGGQHKLKKAHRLSYEALVGPIPDGLEIDHLCRVRNCIRPDHLEAVPGYVNNARSDSISSLNARKTHCPQGHPYDEVNTHHAHGRRYCRECRRRKAAAA